MLPRLAAQGVAWILLGYTPHLWLCAAGENLLFSVAFALTVALLASLTRNLAHFFLAIAIMVGGIFAWAVTVGMLRRIGAIIPHAAGPWFEQSSFQDSVTAAALLVFIGTALIAWIAQARIKWALVAGLFLTLGLIAFPIIRTVWPVNFLKPRLIKSVLLTVFAQTGDSPARVPSVQALSTELAVSSVPKLDVAIMQSLTGSIKFKRGPEFPVDQKSSPFLKRVEPMESQQRGEYVRLIKKCFPAQTLWFDQGNDKKESAFSNLYQDPWFKKSKPPRLATIQGNMELDLFGIEKVAEVPLQPATFHALPGQSVTIQSVKLINDVVVITIIESTANLMLDCDLKSRLNGGFGGFLDEPVCAYVLYDNSSDEALLVRTEHAGYIIPAIFGGRSVVSFRLLFPYPALRERLTGVSAQDWMRSVRLCVFAPVYDGSATVAFHQENCHWPGISFK